MFDSLRSTARAIRRRSLAAVLLVAAAASWGAIAGTADMLPDGVSIEGCWDCDIDRHLDWSFWCVDVTLSCTDGDGNSIEIDIEDAGPFC